MVIPRQDDWEIYDPDGRGAVIFRKRRPWPVPLPVLRGWEDEYQEEDLEEAA